MPTGARKSDKGDVRTDTRAISDRELVRVAITVINTPCDVTNNTRTWRHVLVGSYVDDVGSRKSFETLRN